MHFLNTELKFLLASGFDITTPLKEFHHGTCLHLVSNFGSTTMAYLILSRVTSVKFIDRLDKELRSAIMCAVVGGKNDILKLLIQCGANMTLKVIQNTFLCDQRSPIDRINLQ